MAMKGVWGQVSSFKVKEQTIPSHFILLSKLDFTATKKAHRTWYRRTQKKVTKEKTGLAQRSTTCEGQKPLKEHMPHRRVPAVLNSEIRRSPPS